LRDESDSAVFALSTDVTGENISPVRSHTEWIFLEAIDTPRFPEPWEIDDFQQVLDHLRENGHYRLEGEFIEQQSPKKASSFVSRMLISKTCIRPASNISGL